MYVLFLAVFDNLSHCILLFVGMESAPTEHDIVVKPHYPRLSEFFFTYSNVPRDGRTASPVSFPVLEVNTSKARSKLPC